MFRTYEPARDRLAAVKVFRLDVTPEQARALADELQRLVDTGLVHPSIVTPIAAGVEGSVAYLAEEYVAGESLDVAIRHYAPAALDKALPFIAQLAGALDFARAAGVGHGTLHPRDIFITPEEARATGFGIAGALESIGVRPPVRRPYSAPERVAGGAWGAPADVFALGAIAYELLTGRRIAGPVRDALAVKGSDPLEHSRGSDPLPGLPGAVTGPLARALAEDPAVRYPSALAFARALEAAADGEVERDITDTARPAPLAVPAPPPAREEQQPSLVDALDADAAHRTELAAVDEEISEEREPGESDDVVSERDADLADVVLREEEALARALRPAPFDPSAGSGSPRAGSRGDELRAPRAGRGAQGAPSPSRGAAEPPGPRRLRPEPEPEPALARTTGPTLFDDRDARDEASRDESIGMLGIASAGRPPPRRSMLPLAIVLIAGLLIGFVTGYAVGTRPPTDTAASTELTRAAPPVGGAAPAGTPRPEPAQGREAQAWSEEKVADAPRPATEVPRPPAPEAPAPAAAPPALALRPAQGAPSSSRGGTLTIRSTPSKAGVVVDGRWRGRTPLTLTDLSLGEHTVRVVERGYVAQNSRVTLTPDQRERGVTVTLPRERGQTATPPARRPSPSSASTPAPARPSTGSLRQAQGAPSSSRGSGREAGGAATRFTGSLYVDSRPRGAQVFLDGRPLGTTPLQLADIAVGSHVVRLELAGHRAWATATRVIAGETARVTGSLEQIP